MTHSTLFRKGVHKLNRLLKFYVSHGILCKLPIRFLGVIRNIRWLVVPKSTNVTFSPKCQIKCYFNQTRCVFHSHQQPLKYCRFKVLQKNVLHHRHLVKNILLPVCYPQFQYEYFLSCSFKMALTFVLAFWSSFLFSRSIRISSKPLLAAQWYRWLRDASEPLMRGMWPV